VVFVKKKQDKCRERATKIRSAEYGCKRNERKCKREIRKHGVGSAEKSSCLNRGPEYTTPQAVVLLTLWQSQARRIGVLCD